MSKREIIRKEIESLYRRGATILIAIGKKEEKYFSIGYQRWYTKALTAVSSLAPDRLQEFRSYYEIDPKRNGLNYGTYVIQDYLKGVVPNKYQIPNFDSRKEVRKCFFNQLTILASLSERIESVLSNIEGELYAELQDNEIVVARKLAKANLRAAGALMGVVIEGHLQKVSLKHNIKISKKNPTIADLNEPLKAANVIDTPTWRKISFLSDIRNLCSHKKDSEPTKEQVEELIQGAEWLTKNVF